jgi:8-oxo-dGTP diphosphatase
VSEVIAAAWVCVRDRRLLVVRAAGSDAFYVPGGKPEPGESWAQAAAREVGEETGVVLRAEELTLFAEIVAPAHGRHAGTNVRLVCFESAGNGAGSAAEARAEIAEIGWFTAADRDRCAPAIQLLMDRLIAADRLS